MGLNSFLTTLIVTKAKFFVIFRHLDLLWLLSVITLQFWFHFLPTSGRGEVGCLHYKSCQLNDRMSRPILLWRHLGASVICVTTSETNSTSFGTWAKAAKGTYSLGFVPRLPQELPSIALGHLEDYTWTCTRPSLRRRLPPTSPLNLGLWQPYCVPIDN